MCCINKASLRKSESLESKRLFMFVSNQANEGRVSQLTEEFLLYAEVELVFSKETIIKYRDCLRQVQKICGDLSVRQFSKPDLLRLKADMLSRNLSTNRQVTIILALKRFLRYLAEERKL